MIIGLKERVDRSLEEGGFWEKATFTVPADTPDERVQFHADKYIRRAAEVFEAQGCKILRHTKPIVSLGFLPTDEDRRRYDIFFWLRRRPITYELEIPEALIPEMQSKGLKLK